MPTINEAFDLAWKHHQSGELAQAESIYRQILQAQPNNARAMHLLGLIALQVNMQEAAIQQFQQAIEAAPSNATYYGSLGAVLVEQRRYDEAIETLKKAIKYDPGYHDAYVNLGIALTETGDPETALDQFAEALDINPESSEAYYHNGNALQALGELTDAVAEYRQALYHRPKFPAAHFNLAVALSKLGDDEQAIEHYRQSIDERPTLQALQNLAQLLHKTGRAGETAAVLQQAMTLQPDSPESYQALGELLLEYGRAAEAVEAYRRALQLRPDVPEVQNGLGHALVGSGRIGEALPHLQAAQRARPDWPDPQLGLGNVLLAEGKFAEAADQARAMVARWPDYSPARVNLGIALARLGKVDEALAAYRAAVEQNPRGTEAFYNMATLERRVGRLAEAAEHLRRVIELEPNHALAHNALGGVLDGLGQPDAALASLRKAIELAPDLAEAYNSLGIAERRRGRFAAAEEAFARAIQLRPQYADAFNNRAMTLKDEGRLAESLDDYAAAVQLAPRHPTLHSNLIMSLAYSPDVSPAQILAEARAFGERQSAGLAPLAPPTNPRDPQRPLKIGYVSPDWHTGPVGFFFLALAEHHDRRQYPITCYASQATGDALTERIKSAVDVWRDVASTNDDDLAAQIRRDGIDILVDLSGHAAGNRMRLFARRVAPVQATWLGYFGTTGLATVDYLIGDRYVTPPDEEDQYVERVARLPHSYLCFTPPDEAAPIGPVPAQRNGWVTFGSFNNLAKVTPQVLTAWADVLKAVPNSRLLVKFKSLADEQVRNRLLTQFADLAIGPSRLRLEGASPRAELLRLYNEVDVALDTFPFNGRTATAEALWMGVPVVTLTGDRFVSHIGESILNTVGLEDLVTHSAARYVARAAELAGNLPQLAQFRGQLRPQFLQSLLCNGPLFARSMEDLQRQMWRSWCAGG